MLTLPATEIHTDDRFGGRVAHGAMTAGLISAALTALGDPHVYLVQTVRFLRPVRPGDAVTAVAEITEVLTENRRFQVRTFCRNQRGERVAEGEALLAYMSEFA